MKPRRTKDEIEGLPPGMLRCRGPLGCGKILPESEFYSDKSRKRSRDTNCRACKSKRNAATYRRNPKKYQAQSMRWRRANPEKTRRIRLRADYKKHYGITLEEYEKTFKEQGGLCAICKRPEKAIDKRTGKLRRLAVDHVHGNGKIRGLLCMACNQAIGLLEDNPVFMRAAADYVIESLKEVLK